MRLNPRSQRSFHLAGIGSTHFVNHRFEDVLADYGSPLRRFPRSRRGPAHPNICAYRASAYTLAGETDRAAAALAEARRLSGDDRYKSITRLKSAPGYWGRHP